MTRARRKTLSVAEYSHLYYAMRPLAKAAHRAVWIEVRAGRLPHPRKLSCVDCPKPAKQYDHRDYTKPLAIDPVCRGCNIRRGAGHPYIGAPRLSYYVERLPAGANDIVDAYRSAREAA